MEMSFGQGHLLNLTIYITPMSWIVYIVFGGLVGWVASLIMKTDAQQGILLNVIVGILGSIIGSYVSTFFGFGGVNGFNIGSFLVALLGSVILIGLVKLVRK